MNSKVFMVDEDSPGPAAYGPRSTVGQRNRMPTISNEPAYSVKHRLDIESESQSPGPVYNIASFTCRGKNNAPKYSIGMKLPEKWEHENPGPAAYKPKTDRRQPKLKILLPLNISDPVSPTSIDSLDAFYKHFILFMLKLTVRGWKLCQLTIFYDWYKKKNHTWVIIGRGPEQIHILGPYIFFNFVSLGKEKCLK